MAFVILTKEGTINHSEVEGAYSTRHGSGVALPPRGCQARVLEAFNMNVHRKKKKKNKEPSSKDPNTEMFHFFPNHREHSRFNENTPLE